MDFKNMTVEELEKRMSEIATEVDDEDANLDELEEEAKEIKEEIEERKSNELKKAEIRSHVASGAGTVMKTIEAEEKKDMTLEEVRNSNEYINAYANYIKTNDDSECRALLTTLVDGGQVPVPTYIEGRIMTAWERNGLLDLVRKAYVKGIYKVGFELSATGAAVHTEGADAPAEETLTFGVVELKPESIKKWIRISDEAIDLGGAEFLDYIYDELTYQIAKEAARLLIELIDNAPATSTATAAAVATIAGAPDLTVVASAIANLSDEADAPVIVMNKLTYANFKAAQASANYGIDPFEGLTVHFNNTLPAYDTASEGDAWMIVGDFGRGALANFPNGDEIRIKYDDLTDAESDLVKLVGRMYVGLGIVAENAFVKVTKGASRTVAKTSAKGDA